MKLEREKGAALVLVLLVLTTLGILTSAFVAQLGATLRMIEANRNRARAFYIAEGGIQKVLWELARNPDYQGEASTALGGGFFTVRLEKTKGETNRLRIISTGRLEKIDARHPKQTISVVVEIRPEEPGLAAIQIRRFEKGTQEPSPHSH